MSGKTCLGVGIFLMLCFVPAEGDAARIYLKGGGQIEGQIQEENQHSLRLKVGGQEKTYFLKDLERIDRDAPTAASVPPVRDLQPAVLSKEKKDLVLRLLEANGAREHMSKVFILIIEKAPKETQEELRALLKVDDILEELVPIYNKYYTLDELRELIGFYKSPTGSKHLRSTPMIIEESMGVAVKYFQEKVANSVK